MRYRNQATQRVLSVLLASSRGQIRAARRHRTFARSLGMNKNMAHRALTTLIAAGYLTRDRIGRAYQLSPHVLSLSRGATARNRYCRAGAACARESASADGRERLSLDHCRPQPRDGGRYSGGRRARACAASAAIRCRCIARRCRACCSRIERTRRSPPISLPPRRCTGRSAFPIRRARANRASGTTSARSGRRRMCCGAIRICRARPMRFFRFAMRRERAHAIITIGGPARTFRSSAHRGPAAADPQHHRAAATGSAADSGAALCGRTMSSSAPARCGFWTRLRAQIVRWASRKSRVHWLCRREPCSAVWMRCCGRASLRVTRPRRDMSPDRPPNVATQCHRAFCRPRDLPSLVAAACLDFRGNRFPACADRLE